MSGEIVRANAQRELEREVEGGEIVQVDRIEQPLTIYNPSIRRQWDETGFYSSREATSMESRRKLWNAKMSTISHVEQLMSPHGVEVTDIILCPAVFKADDGKKVAGAKMVLIDSKGECVNVTSRVFIESLLSRFYLPYLALALKLSNRAGVKIGARFIGFCKYRLQGSGIMTYSSMAVLGAKYCRKYTKDTTPMITEPNLSIAQSTFPCCSEREELEKLAKAIVSVIHDNVLITNSIHIAKLYNQEFLSDGGKKWQSKQIEMYSRRANYAKWLLKNNAGWREVFTLLTRKVGTNGKLV